MRDHRAVLNVEVARSSWAQQVQAAELRIRSRLTVRPGPATGSDSQADDVCVAAIDGHLRAAHDVTTGAPPWWAPQRRLGEWWSGRRIETAWAHVREADLLLTGSPGDNPAFARANADHARAESLTLPPGNAARKAFETRPVGAGSTALQTVLEAAFDYRKDYHSSARALRNRLIVVTVLVLLAAAGLLVLQVLVPTAQLLPQPRHDTTSGWVRMLIVMIFGGVGALITAIPVMSQVPRIAGPYNFPLQQSLTKIAVGTLSGLIGVLVIGAPDVTGGFTSFGALVGAAVVFGAGQQTVTRYLDRRAKKVVAKMPTASGKIAR